MVCAQAKKNSGKGYVVEGFSRGKFVGLERNVGVCGGEGEREQC